MRRLRCILAICGVVLALAFHTSDSSADTPAYKYDVLGRLIEVTYSNGTRVTYAYDDAGNRVEVIVKPSGGDGFAPRWLLYSTALY